MLYSQGVKGKKRVMGHTCPRYRSILDIRCSPCTAKQIIPAGWQTIVRNRNLQAWAPAQEIICKKYVRQIP